MGLQKVSGNMARLKGVIVKYLKYSIRDKPLYFWVIGYPMIFIIIFFLAFNSSGSRSAYQISIINYDVVNAKENSMDSNASLIMVDLFNKSVHDTELTKTFQLRTAFDNGTIFNENDAIDLIKQENLDALIILPENFTEIIIGSTWWYKFCKNESIPQPARDQFKYGLPLQFQTLIDTTNYSSNEQPSVIIHTSPDVVVKTVAQNVFEGIINDMILSYNDLKTLNSTLYEVGVSVKLTAFDYYAPGVVIVGVTIAVMMIGSKFGYEKEKGLLKRLDTTPVPRSIQLIGGGIAQVIFSSVQIIILISMLLMFGVYIHPDANLFLAFLNAFLVAFPCIGLGLIIAAIVKTGDEAGGLSWIVILPLQFFGDAFFPLGEQGIVQFFPTFYGVRAMRQILLQGMGFMEIWPSLLINLVFGIIFLAIGLLIFQKKSQI